MSTDLHASAVPPSETAAGGMVQTFPLRRLRLAAILLRSLASAVGWTIWQQLRTDAVRAATSESGNIAAVLAAQMSRSLAAIDAVLLEVKRTAKDKDVEMPSGFDRAFNNREFQEALHGLPRPSATGLQYRHGGQGRKGCGYDRGLADTWISAPPTVIISRMHAAAAMVISSTSIPSVSKVDGRSIIVFARRLEERERR